MRQPGQLRTPDAPQGADRGEDARGVIDVVFDMETQDPDDFLTLLLLLGHPRVRLKAVTITPGSATQVGLVREALRWFEADIPVGAGDLDHPKSCVSSWHERAYGPVAASLEAERADVVLVRCCDAGTTLLTGAPVKNLGAAMEHPDFHVGRWVAQGGFAGEGVVPRERQLEKFRGMTTCPTFNLNGAPRAALRALTHPGIGARRFVSKNVCHGVVYDAAMHARIAPLRHEAFHLGRIWQGMEAFLSHKRSQRPQPAVLPASGEVRLVDQRGDYRGVLGVDEARRAAEEAGMALWSMRQRGPMPAVRIGPMPDEEAQEVGKKFHDPLAACCAIDPGVGRWAEVELYRERGAWGSRLAPGSGVWIIVDYDPERFFEVLTARRVC